MSEHAGGPPPETDPTELRPEEPSTYNTDVEHAHDVANTTNELIDQADTPLGSNPTFRQIERREKQVEFYTDTAEVSVKHFDDPARDRFLSPADKRHAAVHLDDTIAVERFADELQHRRSTDELRRATDELERVKFLDRFGGGLGSQSAHDKASERDDADPTVSKILMDLDLFKSINTRYLQVGGDAVLKYFNELLAGVLAEEENTSARSGFRLEGDQSEKVGYRLGGDEYVVHVQNDPTGEIAGHVLEQIRATLAERLNSDEVIHYSGGEIKLTDLRDLGLSISAGIGRTQIEANEREQAEKRAKGHSRGE